MAFRSLTVLSVLVSAALAQSNPYIPSGISTACASYLTSLNSDTSFATCTQSLTSALAQFAPGATTTTTLSSASIATTLQSLCKNSAAISCSQSTITAQLSAFYAACSPELTSTPNQSVKTTYDSMYALVPLSQAICAKDDSGNYCAANLSSTTGNGNVALVESPQAVLHQYLYSTSDAPARRDATNTSSTAALVPNTTTFQNTNLVFLFLNPNADANQLCQTCTRNILTPYITFESTSPYAPGLSQSLLFAGQTNLYNNITSKCSAGFLSGAVQAAGGLSGGILGSGALRLDSQELSAAVSAILGVAAFVAASF